MKRIVLGNEYDQELLKRLREILQAKGLRMTDKQWALGGSQELAGYQLEIDGKQLKIELETYLGISLSGEAALVDEIAGLLR